MPYSGSASVQPLQTDKPIKLLSGNANPALANAIAAYIGLPLSPGRITRFADGEVMVEIEENMRGADVFVLQPTCPPVNDNLMELLVMVDALKRASANSITAVVPYFGYGRQDRKTASRSPITAKLVADMMTTSGIQRLLCLDLHAAQIQGFFNVPVDNLYAQPVLVADALKRYGRDNLVVVSPDVGGVVRARATAKALDVPLAIIDKRRPAANQVVVMNVIGDVKGKTCLLLDDMIDTAGTIVNAAQALMELHGAKEVVAYASHGLFSGPAVERINNSVLKEVVVTDSLPLHTTCEKIRIVSAAPLIAEAMRRIVTRESLSALFG